MTDRKRDQPDFWEGSTFSNVRAFSSATTIEDLSAEIGRIGRNEVLEDLCVGWWAVESWFELDGLDDTAPESLYCVHHTPAAEMSCPECGRDPELGRAPTYCDGVEVEGYYAACPRRCMGTAVRGSKLGAWAAWQQKAEELKRKRNW